MNTYWPPKENGSSGPFNILKILIETLLGLHKLKLRTNGDYNEEAYLLDFSSQPGNFRGNHVVSTPIQVKVYVMAGFSYDETDYEWNDIYEEYEDTTYTEEDIMDQKRVYTCKEKYSAQSNCICDV